MIYIVSLFAMSLLGLCVWLLMRVNYLKELNEFKTEEIICEMKLTEKLELALDSTEFDALLLEGANRELKLKLAHMEVLQIERLSYICDLEEERVKFIRKNSDMRFFIDALPVEYQMPAGWTNIQSN